ncbi:MAG: small basic protein [Verrucomicrobiota bacterium]|nr:small basic protein [Verrucomicrobiota bacterium]
MSQHSSFKAAGGASTKKRNVLKRFERVQLLKRRGQFVEKAGVRVTGLIKTKPDV